MITLLLVIVIIGLGLYLVEAYVPMSPPFKIVLRVVAIIILIFYLLRVFGISDIPVR